jgi:hypothetical protein
MPSAEALSAIRSWIAVGQASAPALGDDLTAGIPDDFVKKRKDDPRVRQRAVQLFLVLNLVVRSPVSIWAAG